ncbi:uncharacterized protein LOC142349321 isoform X1 [Convolutriloba macropyga]|uniref:uncharacterized protein LOC142349321 isoform X1 n=1 Tax=Convolutriloba macropyga TaxID=536237 RepID=UPI003F52231A
MAQSGQKILLVAKIKQKTGRLNNAIADKNPNFDIKSFKFGINADLDELELCVRAQIDNAQNQSDVEELTKEVMELRQNAEEAVEKYQGTVCKWKLAFLKMAVPTKVTLRSVATTLIFNWRVGCRFLAILLAVAILVIRRIFQYEIWWDIKYSRNNAYQNSYGMAYDSNGNQYNPNYYQFDKNVYGDRALEATAWTCLSFSVFLGVLNMLERGVGIKSIGCKVFDIVMSVAAVALWSLSIVLIVLYNVKYDEGYPKGYNIIQLTLCALSLFLQILWILANVREIIKIRRSRKCDKWETLPNEKHPSLATLT